MAAKNGKTKKDFSPSSFGAVVGSGIRYSRSGMDTETIQDPVCIPDPQHWVKGSPLARYSLRSLPGVDPWYDGLLSELKAWRICGPDPTLAQVVAHALVTLGHQSIVLNIRNLTNIQKQVSK